MDGVSKGTLSLSMDNLYIVDMLLSASPEILIYYGSRFFRAEGMKINNAVNRMFYDVHRIENPVVRSQWPGDLGL